MQQEQTVIYVARTRELAHLLRNDLDRAGIEAVVINDALSGGAGTDALGWSSMARVVVDARDARSARRIALEFDRNTARGSSPRDEEDQEILGPDLDHWPRCPDCSAPRPTRCPICQTIGHQFPLADPEYVWGMGLGEVDANSEETLSKPEEDRSALETVLMCPTCDEPFLPEYPKTCAWCGHEFEEGFDVGPIQAFPEEISGRVTLVLLGLGIVAVVVAAYFMLIV